MFKNRKKRQQQQKQRKAGLVEQQQQEQEQDPVFRPLDEIQVARDFRTSLIMPELGNDQVTAETSIVHAKVQSPHVDATRQYQDLAAWRAMRNHNRYSNSLFGGKQRDRPKIKRKDRLKLTEEEDEEEEDAMDSSPNPELRLNSPPPTPPEASTPQDEKNPLELFQDYENDDESVENYFFQDFAPTSDSQKPTPRLRSKKQTHRARSVKAMSKFDLASFARHLHDNRLSVVQPRESRIVLTEEDEKELEMLLKRKSKFDLGTTVPSAEAEVTPLPPVLPAIATETKSSQEDKENQASSSNDAHDLITDIREVFPENMTIPLVNDDRSTTPVSPSPSSPVSQESLSIASERPASPLAKKPSLLLQKLNRLNIKESEKILIEDNLSTGEVVSISPSASEPSVMSAPIARLERNLSNASNLPSRSPSVSSSSLSRRPSMEPVIQIRKTQSTSRKASSGLSSNLLSPIQDEANEDGERERKPRKSVSMDGIGHILREQVASESEGWTHLKQEVEAYRNNGLTIKQDSSTEDGSEPNPQKSNSRKLKEEKDEIKTTTTKSLGLFGSLRQASRSRSGSFRGLVRNLSQAHRQEKRQPSSSSPQAPTMSRAAMAVIQHNAAQRSSSERSHDSVEAVGNEKVELEETGSKTGGVSLISHLLTKATKRKTKTVNMDQEDSRPVSSKPSRAQVVRRTIIYVQPDSINFMKTLQGFENEQAPPVPPVPSLGAKSSLRPTSNETMLSSEKGAEYSQAVKVTRQTSVKKRIVEKEASDRTAGGRSDNTKKWHLESVHDDVDSVYGYYENRGSTATCLQGLELREMSDGTVVWGVVQKQGNRKSFYAHKDQSFQQQEEEDTDSDNIEAHVLALMGLEPGSLDQPPSSPPPIPRRSPRRPVGITEPSSPSTLGQRAKHISTIVSSNTDIYYAPEVTLPSLLQMMAASTEGNEVTAMEKKARQQQQHASIEQQLDEMMASFSKHG
ncbi:hypothetical protein EC973_006834 [Apophysomyces ossiformis]|uniref:Uncharacterized protein n=1 Tax=Apophysomyces ossiformis TaxID=679940 RepID=A0A8H7BUP1_9FUNG|nr:hypothetical protein EC973_006834 [Apophysomyces ossiformis]